MMMAYTPIATAHAVAVLLSTEEAEGITGSVSTTHKKHHTLEHTSEYHQIIDFLMLFPAAWMNMHNHHQGHTPRDWGKCTRLTHLRHHIRTQNM
jgi:hypothetical protein